MAMSVKTVVVGNDSANPTSVNTVIVGNSVNNRIKTVVVNDQNSTIKGVKGDLGPVGPQGPTGPQGPVGPPGPDMSAQVVAAIDQEIIDRQVADENLQTQINNLISNSDPSVLDSLSEILTTLQSAIAAEQSARIAADEQISAVLDPISAVTFCREKIVISNTSYVDLSHIAIENSLHIMIGRLAVHQDEDFTVSEVNGATRITWIGSLADMGIEAVEIGDSIFAYYSYSAVNSGGDPPPQSNITAILNPSKGVFNIDWSADAVISSAGNCVGILNASDSPSLATPIAIFENLSINNYIGSTTLLTQGNSYKLAIYDDLAGSNYLGTVSENFTAT